MDLRNQNLWPICHDLRIASFHYNQPLGSPTPQSLARQRGTSGVTKEISAAKARPTRWFCDLKKDHWKLCPCSTLQDLLCFCSRLKWQVTTKYLNDARNGCKRVQIWLPFDEETPIHLYDRTGTHVSYKSWFKFLSSNPWLVGKSRCHCYLVVLCNASCFWFGVPCHGVSTQGKPFNNWAFYPRRSK